VHGVQAEVLCPVIVFLTACTRNRSRWLASNEVHLLLHELWVGSDAWLVGDYVLMPDHLHLFAAPNPTKCVELENWVRYWKSQFTKRHGNATHRWQTDHWDRRVRKEENYLEKWEYVRNNPVRHKLVTKPEDWPYQGKIHQLVW